MNWEILRGTLKFWPSIIIGGAVAFVLIPIVLIWAAILLIVAWPVILLLGVFITLFSAFILWYAGGTGER